MRNHEQQQEKHAYFNSILGECSSTSVCTIIGRSPYKSQLWVSFIASHEDRSTEGDLICSVYCAIFLPQKCAEIWWYWGGGLMSYQKICWLSVLSTKNNSYAILLGTCLQILTAEVMQLTTQDTQDQKESSNVWWGVAYTLDTPKGINVHLQQVFEQ